MYVEADSRIKRYQVERNTQIIPNNMDSVVVTPCVSKVNNSKKCYLCTA